jgi:hypothetical protein
MNTVGIWKHGITILILFQISSSQAYIQHFFLLFFYFFLCFQLIAFTFHTSLFHSWYVCHSLHSSYYLD